MIYPHYYYTQTLQCVNVTDAPRVNIRVHVRPLDNPDVVFFLCLFFALLGLTTFGLVFVLHSEIVVVAFFFFAPISTFFACLANLIIAEVINISSLLARNPSFLNIMPFSFALFSQTWSLHVLQSNYTTI
jgi:hypothetical protein